MKKIMYAALFLGALSSCSNDDDRIAAPEAGNNGDSDLQAIALSVSNNDGYDLLTRGQGMVGGLTEETNKWNAEELYVVMRKLNTTDAIMGGTDATSDLGYWWEGIDANYSLLNDRMLTAPTNSDSALVTCTDGAPYFYYPVTGSYDFYGYHVNDAYETQKPALVKTDDEKNEYVAFKIDGTQDLMTAKADYDQDKLDGNGNLKAQDLLAVQNLSYSSYAARRGVQPVLKFKHQLTKLNFFVVNMNAPAAGAVEVDNTNGDISVNDASLLDGKVYAAGGDAITVTDITLTSTAEGNLYVTETPDAAKNVGDIDWTTEIANAADNFTVKQAPTDGSKNLVALEEVPLAYYNVNYEIGEGLMLRPYGNNNDYKGSVTFVQNLKTEPRADGELDDDEVNDGYVTKVVEQTVELVIPANQIYLEKDNGKVLVTEGFEAGKAYNVYIKVYGLQKIEITAVLTPWEMGGDVTINPEDELFNPADFYVVNSWYVTDQATFNQLPESYRLENPWNEGTTPVSLPWLAVNFNPTPANELDILVEGPDGFSKTIRYDMDKVVSLLILEKEELGHELTPGEWTVTINGVATTITVE